VALNSQRYVAQAAAGVTVVLMSGSRSISDTLAAGGQTAASAPNGGGLRTAAAASRHTCSAGTISVLAEVEVGALVVGAL